jgi:hypothetical protein
VGHGTHLRKGGGGEGTGGRGKKGGSTESIEEGEAREKEYIIYTDTTPFAKHVKLLYTHPANVPSV